jgi:putative ABC transport system permease protein
MPAVSPQSLLQVGLAGLMTHKLRSVLSVAGVLFGVAAVVAMSSVGEGARREALAQIGALGIDSISVKSRPDKGDGLRGGDAEALARLVPGVVAVAALRDARLPADVLARQTNVDVVGTTPGYAAAARLRLASGRFLADLDLAEGQRVAVLGAGVARRLSPVEDLRGQTVRLGTDHYTVVGILEDRPLPRARGNPIRSRDVNLSIFVPLRALDLGAPRAPDAVDELVLRVRDDRGVVEAAEVVKVALTRRAGPGTFEIVVPREILRQRERTQRIFNVVTGAVAAIGLLVGGIGIMNIMLASVAERTHEIGVRRACGATRGDIARQFLSESLLLTGAGGLLGALVGVLGSIAIQRWADWPTALSPAMLLLALCVAGAVGVGFGSYPAQLAARLEPAEALRRE